MTRNSQVSRRDLPLFRGPPASFEQLDRRTGSRPLSELLTILIEAARCNQIPAPATAPDSPSLIDQMSVLQDATAGFEVMPGLSLKDYFWTHHSHLRTGEIAERLLQSAKFSAMKDLRTSSQGFIALYATTIRSPLLYGPKRLPFRVTETVEVGTAIGGPFLALVQCALSLDGRAQAVRAFAQPIYHARRFVPVASELERDVLRSLEAVQVALDAHGVDCSVNRCAESKASQGLATISIAAARNGSPMQCLKIAVLPTVHDEAPDDVDYAVTPARWADGSFVRWLDGAILR